MKKNTKIVVSFVVVIIIGVLVYIQTFGAKPVEQSVQNAVVTEQSPTAYEVINGVTVPPEPDPELNNATLAGIDVNENGVRDDVERWIVRTYPNSEKTQKILMIMAREFESALFYTKSDNTQSAILAQTRVTDSIDCLWYIRSDDAISIRSLLFAQILSTKERTLTYVEYNRLSAGSPVDRQPEEFKDGCTGFDPDLLIN